MTPSQEATEPTKFDRTSTYHPFIKQVLHDKIIGSLYGSALSDAIGLYTEFLPKTDCQKFYPSGHFSLTEPTPRHGDRHRDRFLPCRWTDDTDHALLIILSYLHNNGELSTLDFAERLKVWVQQGLRALDSLPLGLGATVKRVVLDKQFLEDPEGMAYKHWAAGGHFNAANGSLMRTHPLGVIVIGESEKETMNIAAKFSRVTHQDLRCVVSCCIGTLLVRGLILGVVDSEEAIDGIVSRAVDWCMNWRAEKMKEKENEDFDWPRIDLDELLKHTKAETLTSLQLDDGQKMGFVYKTLGSGILLLRQAIRQLQQPEFSVLKKTHPFEQLITNLIMEGGDADTNACFAGALLGAYLSFNSLPAHWRDGLRDGEWLLAKAEAVCQVLGVVDTPHDKEKHKDTAIDGGRGFMNEQELHLRVQELEMSMYQMAADRQKAKEEAEGLKKGDERGIKKVFGRFVKSNT